MSKNITKNMTKNQMGIIEHVVKLGGKSWNYGNKYRTYITCDILNILEKENGGRGDYSLNDQNNKIWLDDSTGKIMRSYNKKRPQVELDLNQKLIGEFPEIEIY